MSAPAPSQTVHGERRVLVVGATGLVGRAAIEHYRAIGGWRVTGLSRRRPPDLDASDHLAVDLADASAVRRAVCAAPAATRVVYTALFEKPDLVAGWVDPAQIDTNVLMLRNLLDALAGSPSAATLRHVTLLQGTKAYGSHVRRVPVPAKERWPRGDWPIFYWPQEDLLRERAGREGWSFTLLRPQLILGGSPGSPMNFVLAIGAYAAIRRELGLPLAYPGGGRFVTAASDSRLIARAIAWSGDTPAAWGATFNVANGDAVTWRDLWPAIARHFEMPVGADEPARLADTMPGLEAAWRSVVARHGLVPGSLADRVGSSWRFADRNLAAGDADPPDRLTSPIALRRAGFHDCEDTEDAFLHWLERMQRERLLPR